jgi:hypothetical protein
MGEVEGKKPPKDFLLGHLVPVVHPPVSGGHGRIERLVGAIELGAGVVAGGLGPLLKVGDGLGAGGA